MSEPQKIKVTFPDGEEIGLNMKNIKRFVRLNFHDPYTWSIQDAETSEELMIIKSATQPPERLRLQRPDFLKDIPCAEFKITVSDNLKGEYNDGENND